MDELKKTADDYRRAGLALLPQGLAWPRHDGGFPWLLCEGLGRFWARLHDKIISVFQELDPKTTVDLIDAWEADCGIVPDPSLPPAVRRQRVLQVLLARRGQSIEFIVGTLAALGLAAEVREFRPFICGWSRCGDALNGGEECRFYWEIAVDGSDEAVAAAEAIIGKIKPAQTQVRVVRKEETL